jgi:predicted RNA-binding protein with PIN domain
MKPVICSQQHIAFIETQSDIDMPYWFDGNNLIGQSAETARADSRTRRAFLSMLSAYHRSGGGRFLVYFDGDDPNRTAAPPGVSVRYSAPLSTDEAIIRRLKEVQQPSEVIVVTNDRGLMNRCRNAGAITMNWRRFASKMQYRCAPPGTRKDSQEPVDVEDWLRYFGLNK